MSQAQISLQGQKNNVRSLEKYYKLHAGIYNLTRWAFLFGRDKIIQEIGCDVAKWNILEIGCGTGHNLKILKKCFPEAKITGIDVSPDMLQVAERSLGKDVELLNQAYIRPLSESRYDMIVCSYTLSMIPRYQDIMDAVKRDLRPGGIVAVVDFHATRWNWFKKWMGFNHVKMEGQLQPALERRFKPIQNITINAYGCFWKYLMFIGKK